MRPEFDGVDDWVELEPVCPRCLERMRMTGDGGYRCPRCGLEVKLYPPLSIWNQSLSPLEVWRLYMLATGHRPGFSRGEVIPP